MKGLGILSNSIAPTRNSTSAIVPRGVISTSTRVNRVNRIVSPIHVMSKSSVILPSSLPEAAIQGIVRVIIDGDAIEIYHSKVNETFPKKLVIVDNQAMIDKLEFIKNNVEYMTKINEIVDIATSVFSSSPLNQSAVLDYMTRAFLNNDKNFGLSEAIVWGDGFVFPPEVHTKHADRFEELNYDLEALIDEVQAINKSNRFNLERVTKWCEFDPDGPDNHRLLAMVLGGGVILHPAEDFEPNWKHGLPALSSQYIAARAPVNKMIYDQYLNRLCILLPKRYFDKLEGSQFSKQGWHTKAESEKGRQIWDGKNLGRDEGDPINSKEMKQNSIDEWDSIRYPTVYDIANMVWNYAIKMGWLPLIMYKEDLMGAFTLIDVIALCCKLLCTELTEDLLCINIACTFGGNEFPFIMNVISRVLQRQYDILLRGSALIYSDDTFGICLYTDLLHDYEIVRNLIHNLLGPNSIADNPTKLKRECGRIIDVIGWRVDLDLRIISMSPRNGLKLAYAFFDFDIRAVVKVKVLQKLASLASRASQICPFMKPFGQELYRMAAKADGHTFPIHCEPGAKFVIKLWRVMIILMNMYPSIYTRSIESFVFKLCRYGIDFDGCLYGIGFTVYEIVGDERKMIGYCACDIEYFLLGEDSSYQNTSEFIAQTMAIAWLTSIGIVNQPIHLIGDSVSAITWAKDQKFNSVNCQRAAILFSTLGFYSCNYVAEVEHISGVMNDNNDGLSRFMKVDDIPEYYKPFEHLRIYIEKDVKLLKLLDWCNPKQNELLFKDEGSMSCELEFLEIVTIVKGFCNK